jgi:hypothetical protein
MERGQARCKLTADIPLIIPDNIRNLPQKESAEDAILDAFLDDARTVTAHNAVSKQESVVEN